MELQSSSESENSDRLWNCAWCGEDSHWPLGLRWNVRNARRFGSWQFAVTLPYVFLCMYFNTVIQCIVEARSQRFDIIPDKYNMTKVDRDELTTLPDLGFDFLPDMSAYATLSDAVVVGFVGLTMIRFALTPMGATIVRRWLFCLGTLFFLRGIAIIATLLPNPLKECTTDALDYNPFYAGLLILMGQIVTCADVLYSGHTVNATLCALVWHQYSHKRGALLFEGCDPIGTLLCPQVPVENRYGHIVRATAVKIGVFVYTFLALLVIIAARFHYTIDVFIGFCMCLFMWKFYHYYIRHLHQDQEKCFNVFLAWWERDSEEFEPLFTIHDRGLSETESGIVGEAELTVSAVGVDLPTGP